MPTLPEGRIEGFGNEPEPAEVPARLSGPSIQWCASICSAPLNGAPLYNTPLYIAHHLMKITPVARARALLPLALLPQVPAVVRVQRDHRGVGEAEALELVQHAADLGTKNSPRRGSRHYMVHH